MIDFILLHAMNFYIGWFCAGLTAVVALLLLGVGVAVVAVVIDIVFLLPIRLLKKLL